MPSSTQVKEINERLTQSYTKAGILQTQQVSITCFTGTKVQILTQVGEQEAAEKAQAVAEDETTAAGARAAAAEAKEQAEAQVCYHISVSSHYHACVCPIYCMLRCMYRTTSKKEKKGACRPAAVYVSSYYVCVCPHTTAYYSVCIGGRGGQGACRQTARHCRGRDEASARGDRRARCC